MKTLLKKVLDQANLLAARIDPLFMSGSRFVTPPLFIVGAPRSGTTLAYQIVTQQFQVAYFTGIMAYLYGLPNLTARLLKPLTGRPSPVFQSRYGRVPGLLAPAEPANFWFRWFPLEGESGHYLSPETVNLQGYIMLVENLQSIAAIHQKPLVVKNLYLGMVVGILAQIFPTARFILVQRDLLLTCQSLIKRRQMQADPMDWWSVKPPQYYSIQSRPLWQQVAEQVFYINRTVKTELDRYASGRYLQVQYQDLCYDPQGFINELQALLEPVGYKRYDSVRVPDTFTPSTEIRLDSDLCRKLVAHLEYLETKEET